jgi:hypothetical protein
MFSKTFVTVAAFLFSSLAIAQEQVEDVQLIQQQALSLIQACQKTGEAITKGDCLIKHEYSYNTIDAVRHDEMAEKMERTGYYRVAFDFDAKRFVLVVNSLGRKTNIQPDISKEKDVEVLSEQLFGSIANHEFAYSRSLPESKVRTEFAAGTTGCEQFLEQINFPDLRVAGLQDIRKSDLFTRRDRVEALWISFAENFKSIERQESGSFLLTCSFDVPHSTDGKKYVQVTKYEIDPERFVVLKISIDILEKESLRNIGKLYRQTVDWKDHAGLFLPTRITTSKPGRFQVNGRFVGAVEEIVQTVHWYSINKVLDESIFDDIILDKTTEMIRLSDPKSTNASTFLEANSETK